MKKVFFLILILSILIANFSCIRSYYKNLLWKYLFDTKQYEKALKYFDNTNIWNYNKANTFYKLWDYKRAIAYYLSIKTNKIIEKYYLLHNLWNSYYKLWELFENSDKNKMINYRKISVKYYEKALKLWKWKIDSKDLLETKSNLEYVLNKLKNNKNNNYNKNKEKNDKNNEINNKKQSNLSKETNKVNKSKSNWTNNKSLSIKKKSKSTNWTNNKSLATKNKGKKWDEKYNNQNDKSLDNILENYSKQLQEEQKKFIYNYNKKYKPKNNDLFDIFEQFENDPFFQELPNNQEWKDW